MEFKDIDKAAGDKSIYSADIATLLQYRQELDRVATSSGDNLFWLRRETLHKLVCDLIAKHEATEREKRILEAQEKLHRKQIAEQQRLHKAQIAAAESLQKKSSGEEGNRHKKTQSVAWLAVVISFATLAVAALAYFHDLQNTPRKTEPFLPLLLNPSAQERVPTALTNFVPTNSMSATNQAQPITTNKESQ
jgi:hypothetical protein